jgi:hypothetical protein
MMLEVEGCCGGVLRLELVGRGSSQGRGCRRRAAIARILGLWTNSKIWLKVWVFPVSYSSWLTPSRQSSNSAS